VGEGVVEAEELRIHGEFYFRIEGFANASAFLAADGYEGGPLWTDAGCVGRLTKFLRFRLRSARPLPLGKGWI